MGWSKVVFVASFWDYIFSADSLYRPIYACTANFRSFVRKQHAIMSCQFQDNAKWPITVIQGHLFRCEWKATKRLHNYNIIIVALFVEFGSAWWPFVVNSLSTMQGRWFWHQSKARVQLPINDQSEAYSGGLASWACPLRLWGWKKVLKFNVKMLNFEHFWKCRLQHVEALGSGGYMAAAAQACNHVSRSRRLRANVAGVKLIIVNFITDKSRFYRVYCRSTITAANIVPVASIDSGSLLSSTPTDDASCCCWCCWLLSSRVDDGDYAA